MNSLQTSVLPPPPPLHLDFKWPILYRVVTLETASPVSIKRATRRVEGEHKRGHGLIQKAYMTVCEFMGVDFFYFEKIL